MRVKMNEVLPIKKGMLQGTHHCRLIRYASVLFPTDSSSIVFSCDQLKKLQDRVSKAKEEVTRTKDKYESALSELNEYNPKYMEDMRTVFDKCQEFERKRLKFFKETLFSIHGCLNISNRPELVRIYEEYRHTIQNADAQKDLKYWSNAHGVDMAMNWPTFEVCSFLIVQFQSIDSRLMIVIAYPFVFFFDACLCLHLPSPFYAFVYVLLCYIVCNSISLDHKGIL